MIFLSKIHNEAYKKQIKNNFKLQKSFIIIKKLNLKNSVKMISIKENSKAICNYLMYKDTIKIYILVSNLQIIVTLRHLSSTDL